MPQKKEKKNEVTLSRIRVLNEERRRIQSEVQERTATYITGAFGLVAGLAWNDAITGLIDYYVPLGQNTLAAKFIYAGVMTIIVVIITVYVVRFMSRQKK